MFDVFKKAVENFIASIEGEIDNCKKNPDKGFVSKINISGDENYDVFVVIPKKKLDYVSEYLFGDTNYDEKDLTNEIANMIVGNAKVIASEKGKHFDISTPEFMGEFKEFDYDEILKFKYKGVCFYVLFKKR